MDYDTWKTSTPWDNEPDLPEIYKADKYEFFTDDEPLVDEFDKKMLEFEYHVVPVEYDSREEYLLECAENTAEEIGLDSCEESILMRISQNEYNEYLDAVENGYKGKMKRRFR